MQRLKKCKLLILCWQKNRIWTQKLPIELPNVKNSRLLSQGQIKKAHKC